MKNNYRIENGIAWIELPRRRGGNLFAAIDLEDLEKVKEHDVMWRPFASRNTYYVVVREKKKGAPIQYLHHVILGTTISDEIMPDHKDRNGLNNRKENLRLTSRSNNRINAVLGINNTTGVQGVFWHKQHKKWEAVIIRKGIRTPLGSFKSKSKAREARLIAEQVLDGCLSTII